MKNLYIVALTLLSLFVGQLASGQELDGLYLYQFNQFTVEEGQGSYRSWDYAQEILFTGEARYDEERGVGVIPGRLKYFDEAEVEITTSPDGIYREFKITVKIPTHHPQIITWENGYELYEFTVRLGERELGGSFTAKLVESNELIHTMSGSVSVYALPLPYGGKG